MKKIFPLLLFTIALGCCIVAMVFALKSLRPDRIAGQSGSSSTQNPSAEHPPGAVLVDVPWKHLPSVPQFVLTNQHDETFDSATLAGKPYAVSFFFASCPSICRDLNAQVQRLNEQLRNEDVGFVSISVDPEKDTPEILERYANDYNATPERWAMLTGPLYKVREIGEQIFRVIVDPATHTDNILLVDKWGRYRDRFKWDDPYDMKRFTTVVKELASETEPPLEKTIHTRNAMAGLEIDDVSSIPWIREFHLVERSGKKFYSREMTGRVWIANFFFTSCPGICQKQNEYLRALQERLADHPATIVSITTDPNTDLPAVLSEYANKFSADQDKWLFCTGNELLIRRISSEFFRAHASENHHSSQLFVVDKWGNLRGDFNWQEADQEVAMLELIDQLNAETVPPADLDKK